MFEERGYTLYSAVKELKTLEPFERSLYRLKKNDGRVDLISSKLLEALCDALKAKPGDLLERDKKAGA